MIDAATRSAALLVPLSAVRTRAQAGIGEITDIPALADLARSIGCRAIQLLPLAEPIRGCASPYSGRSAFAIDPIYVGLGPLDVPDDPARVDFAAVRAAKERALEAAFADFRAREWPAGERAFALRRFRDEEAYWLEEYALFRAIEDAQGGLGWPAWPAPLRDRDTDALARERARLEDRVLFHCFCQHLANEQWRAARAAAAAKGVRIAGDLPFMVATDSADVWSDRDGFRTDASIGAPPDALAPEGQDWGLPAYRWDAHARSGYRWIRERARRMAAIYDLYRVDHLVGYYRTYVISHDKREKGFVPPDEPAQRAQGEAVLTAMREAGAEIFAEDLGTIPPFVRRSLADLRLAGYRVLRWERRWDVPGQPFIEPADFPALSVATTGTHDTTTLAVWWEREIGPHERGMLLPGAPAEFTPEVRDALLDAALRAGSSLAIVPLQDILGSREQINVPGTVNDTNWTWRVPFRLEDAWDDPNVRPRLETFARLAAKHGRA